MFSFLKEFLLNFFFLPFLAIFVCHTFSKKCLASILIKRIIIRPNSVHNEWKINKLTFYSSVFSLLTVWVAHEALSNIYCITRNYIFSILLVAFWNDKFIVLLLILEIEKWNFLLRHYICWFSIFKLVVLLQIHLYFRPLSF